MKKLVTLLLVVMVSFAFTANAFSETKDTKVVSKGQSKIFETWMHKGNFMVNVGANYSYLGLGIGGGAEMILTEFTIADIVPFQVGGMVRGFVDPISVYGLSFGAGGLITLHFSIKSLKLDIPYADNTDWYIGLGLGLNIVPNWTSSYYWYGDPNGLGLWSTDGLNYFLNENMAVFAEYTYFGQLSGGTLGLMLKL